MRRFSLLLSVTILTGDGRGVLAFRPPVRTTAHVQSSWEGLRPILPQAQQKQRYQQNYHPQQSQRTTALCLALEDEDDFDDDDTEPLARGVDSVSWLPSVVGGTPSASATGDTEVLPLFPLGGIVYTPNSEHVLNIFEPRYRQMYTDILMNGTKRFVVSMSHPNQPGRFAKTGVLFELKDLKEVSEQTKDQIKYICSHTVTRRVQLHQVLNPEAWESRETYLRVEGTILPDDDNKADDDDDETAKKSSIVDQVYGVIAAAATTKPSGDAILEEALRQAFGRLVTLQHELEETVRFTKASVLALAVSAGAGEDGLWQTIRLWQSFVDQRLVARQNELQRDFQEKLQSFLKKDRGLADDELPSAIGFNDLTPALQQEVQELQKRMAIELEPLMLESTLTMQKLLEADNHLERLKLMKHFIQAETKRLETKRALQGMFQTQSDDDEAKLLIQKSSDDDATTKKETPAAKATEPKTADFKPPPPPPPTESMFDDPDAFQ